MKYLGVDYGKKKIGLALSEGLFASPFKILSVSSLRDALEQIVHIIRSEQINVLVIGIPESGEARKIVESFLKELHKQRFDVQIIEVDETLSSQQARDEMIELNIKRQKRAEEDAYAASVILQNYLDSIQK